MWSLMLAAVLAAGPEVQVRSLAGTTTSGRLVELSTQQVTVETAGQSQATPIKSLERITIGGSPVQTRGAFQLELVDGSVLITQGYTVAKHEATATNPAGQAFALSTERMAAIRLGADTPELLEQWDRIRQQPHAADVLVVKKDNTLDFLEGVLGDITAERIAFTLDGEEPLAVNRTKVYGLIYYHKAGAKLPESLCQVQLTDGSRWEAQTLGLEADKLRLTSVAGPSIAVPLNSVSYLDFARGKIVFLSDLQPLSTKVTPFWDLTPAPRRDTNLEGGPLRVGGKEFRKGLALHSQTEMVFSLQGKYRRFLAVLGIDDLVGNQGHAVVIITGDNKLLFTGEVSGNEDGRDLEVDVTGIQRLKILVDFGKDRDVADHVDLCEARVVQ